MLARPADPRLRGSALRRIAAATGGGYIASMLTQLANPSVFLRWSGAALPFLAAAAAVLLAVGLSMAWFLAPADYQQGETVRIMFLHVPAAWLALCFYAIMAASALGTLVWRHPLADVSQKAAAPIGAGFALICLVTGALWGKPMWGAYWVWDARLTSVLVLFLMYCGILALWRTIEDPSRAARAVSILTLVGVRQPADHQVLGRLVEHPAPAGLGVPRSAARRSTRRCSTRCSSWPPPSR